MTKEELAIERNEVREILEDFSEELSQSNLDKLSRVFCIINGDEKCIAELEKENAELKGLVNQYKASKCSGISLVNRNMIMSDQLAKAKELLKEFVHHYKDKTIYIENMQDLLEQAEQFLNSEGK